MEVTKRYWIVPLSLALAGAVGALGYSLHRPPTLLPPLHTETVTVVEPSPNVVVAVRDLRELGTQTMHLERVIEAKTHEPHLFGAITADDSLLLIAAGDVTAGIDLSELREGDFDVDWSTRRVKITLPAAKVLSSRIDNDRTRVHSRSTDVLAHRNESLESEARTRAEKEMVTAALDAQLLAHASESATRTVEDLVRALGFRDVTVTTRS